VEKAAREAQDELRAAAATAEKAKIHVHVVAGQLRAAEAERTPEEVRLQKERQLAATRAEIELKRGEDQKLKQQAEGTATQAQAAEQPRGQVDATALNLQARRDSLPGLEAMKTKMAEAENFLEAQLLKDEITEVKKLIF
jgi:hypothetical protein